jgi:hypothetical protein
MMDISKSFLESSITFKEYKRILKPKRLKATDLMKYISSCTSLQKEFLN